MQDTKLKKILEITAVIIFFSAFVLSLSKPIGDIDAFWHLKTGEWIWQNRSLPDRDPFSFTVEPYQYETSARASFILKQYWLAQLIIYGFYQIGGFYGIVAFRCLIYLGIGLVLYYWMGNIKNSSNSLSSSNSSKSSFKLSRMSRLIFLIPMAYFSILVLGERPNNLSFLFSVIVVYLLENLKKNPPTPPLLKGGGGGLNKGGLNAKYYLLLPLVMVIWANMHGGFILGDAIIILYMFAEGIKRVNRSKRVNRVNRVNETFVTSGTFLTFFIICLISILISFVNPNTYKAISTLLELEGTHYSSSISEMMSPFNYAEKGDYKHLIIIGAIVLLFLLRIKQLKLNTALLVSFLAFLALTRVRYIPFLLFISTPFIAEVWKGFFDRMAAKAERLYTLHAARYTLHAIRYTLPLLFVIFLVSSQMKLTVTVFRNPVIYPYFPEAAVKFIKIERPEPEIFNEYGWGGYLIWSLYPDYKVFMDGRGLFLPVFLVYDKALSGSVEDIAGVPEWKAIFNTYKVKAVLVPGINVRGGGFTRLVRRLVDDKEWSLVFVDKQALLFMKDTEKNRGIIRRHSRPKVLAYGKALEQAEIYRIRYPKDWKAYATLGEINLYMGKPAFALLNFESAFRLNPSLKSTILNKLIEELRAGRDYSKLMDEIFR